MTCVEKFHAEGNNYIKKLTHFHCKCKEDHALYALFCEKDPHGHVPTPEMENECTCATVSANDICDFCNQIKYLLIYKCYKLCLERIPVSIQDKLMTTVQYFEVMKSCESFFYFNRESNITLLSLNNPLEPKIKARTDHIYF